VRGTKSESENSSNPLITDRPVAAWRQPQPSDRQAGFALAQYVSS
jgi:hypothetical protein